MSERNTLYNGDDVTLRQYQTGTYGLIVNGLRVIFDEVDTPPATSIHALFNDGKHIADIKRSDVPHEVTLALDKIEDTNNDN